MFTRYNVHCTSQTPHYYTVQHTMHFQPESEHALGTGEGTSKVEVFKSKAKRMRVHESIYKSRATLN